MYSLGVGWAKRSATRTDLRIFLVVSFSRMFSVREGCRDLLFVWACSSAPARSALQTSRDAKGGARGQSIMSFGATRKAQLSIDKKARNNKIKRRR